MIGQEYWFLFGMAFVWSLFGVVQDLRKREVANWLSFSLIAFGLAYRFFYSVIVEDWNFFIYGLIGLGMFYALGNLFYYTRVFGGGDAKLLMGYGIILPYHDLADFVFVGLGFVLLLFVCGSLWSLIYSIKIVRERKRCFAKMFDMKFKEEGFVIGILAILGIVLGAMLNSLYLSVIGVILFGFVGVLWIYVRALDLCLIRKIGGPGLQEGDWLEKESRIGNYVVKKSVHGLSKEDITIIRKSGKKVWIKEGIPFVPGFLISLIFMVFFFDALKVLSGWVFLV